MMLFEERLQDTPASLKAAESDLLQQTGGEAVFWCGRTATALRWAYALAKGAPSDNVATPEIIMPAMCCSTPMNVAISTGVQPRLADCDPETGLLTLQSAQARYTPNTRAVVFVHLYGQTTDLGPLAAWCREKDLLLIEDMAQAQGAVLPGGKPVGSVGNCSVYSFNATKMLECGGGALLLRDADLLPALQEILRTERRAPELTPAQALSYAMSYRNIHHGLVNLCRIHPKSIPEISQGFLSLRGLYDALYTRSLQNPEALAHAWNNLPAILERRREKAEIYAKRLKGGPWRLLNGWRESGACFRYSLLVDFPEQLVPFSEALRSAGYHISNLYWPMDQLFNPKDQCPQADVFGRAVMNLWVDDSVATEQVNKCGEEVLRLTEKMSAKALDAQVELPQVD